MNKIAQKIIFILSIIFFISSCSKIEDIDIVDANAKDVYSYIKSIGFPESSIVDAGKKFIVEGDILFRKDMIVRIPKKGAKVNQRYNSYVSKSKQSSIRVQIDQSVSMLNSEVISAVNMWNNTNSNLHFMIVSDNNYDILIDDMIDNTETGKCGTGAFPSNGNPGNSVHINIPLITGAGRPVFTASYEQKVVLIAHELGHCVGLTHTNSNDGTPVPNFENSDANSIMNMNSCDGSSTQFSNNDVGAIQYLYPLPTPSSTQIQIQIGSDFVIEWNNYYSYVTSYDISYGGFSGQNFGGTVTVSGSTHSFTVPNISPYPSNNPSTGGIQVTIVAYYNRGFGSTFSTGTSTSRNKVNGVWQ